MLEVLLKLLGKHPMSETETLSEDNITDIIEAVRDTIENPSPERLSKDITLIFQLLEKFKSDVNGVHPSLNLSILNLIKGIFV